jgi:hypothetical protein
VIRPTIVLLALPLALGACGGSSPPSPPAATVTTITQNATVLTATLTATTAAPPQPKPKRKPRPGPSPGSLPQTDQLPSAGTPAFHAEMGTLWAGVQTGSLARAMPAFFPEGAYVQLKAIGDPRGDYTDRLVADYQLDIRAAHTLLGSDPASADLVGVHVPSGYAHWVPPGVCDNRVGYYELPNARLVYRQNGAVHSFGIASMISWRGVWYVVHLGAILRPSAGGMVDDPSAGVGTSAPSSTC